MKIRLTDPSQRLRFPGGVLTGPEPVEVADVAFWRRRLRDGSCERVGSTPKPKPKAKPFASKATTED